MQRPDGLLERFTPPFDRMCLLANAEILDARFLEASAGSRKPIKLTPMTVEGVIFDIGGTLIWTNDDKSEAGAAWAAINVFRAHGFPGDPQALWLELLEIRREFPKEGRKL